MEKELKRHNVPQDKILRWQATRNGKNGSLGCTLSHISALEYVETLPETVKRVIILEDDFDFDRDMNMVNESLRTFLEYPDTKWDMALLSYHIVKREDYNTLVSISLESFHTSGYLVHRDSARRLLLNFKEGRDKFISTGQHGSFAIDKYWHKFMQNRKTFYFNKALGDQRNSYSNVSGLIATRKSCLNLS